MVLILIKICRFLLWDFVTLSFNIDILFSIALFSTLFILFFKILSLCTEAYIEPSQTSKGLIIWIFSAQAENFNLVKRVEKKKILYGVFHFGLNIFHLRLNFLGCSQYPFQKQLSKGVLEKNVFLKILQNSQENTYVRVSFLNKIADLRLV